jgi:hypothetical protein
MSPVWALKHRPWPLLTAIAPKLPMNEAVEEESTPYYDLRVFIPHVRGTFSRAGINSQPNSGMEVAQLSGLLGI